MPRTMLVGVLAVCVAGLMACRVCPRRAPRPVDPVVVSSLPPNVYLLADPTVYAELLLGMRVRASGHGHVMLLDAQPGMREGTEIRRAPDATLPPTFTRAGWLAHRGHSDADAFHGLRGDESFVEYEVSDVERITLEGAPSQDDPIVQAVLVGTVRTRCPPIGGPRCTPMTIADAAIAIVVGAPSGPWAELTLAGTTGERPHVIEGEALRLTVAALPGTDLVLRLRDADGTTRTLWRASALPDRDHPGMAPRSADPIAPLHRAIVTLPPGKSSRPRCARIELDVVAPPAGTELDPWLDAAAWDRFVASLPATRWRRITRDVMVVPAAASRQPIDVVCPAL